MDIDSGSDTPSSTESDAPVTFRRPPSWGLAGIAVLSFVGGLWAFVQGLSFWPTSDQENLWALTSLLFSLVVISLSTLLGWWLVVWVRKGIASRAGREVVLTGYGIGERGAVWRKLKRHPGTLVSVGMILAGGGLLLVSVFTRNYIWAGAGVVTVVSAPSLMAALARTVTPPGLRLAVGAGLLALPALYSLLGGYHTGHPGLLTTGMTLTALAAGLVLSVPVWWVLWRREGSRK